jgi:PII-like signaling protein
VSGEFLKLTIYFGERDRAGDRFLADALSEIYARHGLVVSLVMRGVEGFGTKHQLRTDRLLTLSEDLPIVAVAVDRNDRIAAALEDIEELSFDGLVTLERASLLAGGPVGAPGPGGEAKLTVYVGRGQRVAGRPAHEAVVDLMHDRGLAGATVLLGVDGTTHGGRRRAKFFARNSDVPLMIIAVGASTTIATLVPELEALLGEPLATLERVSVCKRDGLLLATPPAIGQEDDGGRGIWQKLVVYSDEQSRHAGRPLHHELIRELRGAGAAGATSMRGIWGYHGDHRPHGDSFWQLRRRVPIVTVIVDTPKRSREWFELVDRLTTESGLVTSELVPAFRASGPRTTSGGLALARIVTAPRP